MTTPQAYMYTILGRHVHGRGIAVSAKTLMDVLSGLDVAERTARMTFARMLERRYLSRYRRGRKVYFGIGPKSAQTIAINEDKLLQRPEMPARVNGVWTLVSFSIPEERRRDRQVLRVRLGWKGFGHLRDGLWIAPGERDISDTLSELGLEEHTHIFLGRPLVDDIWELVEEAWDLEQVHQRQEEFLDRWSADGTLARHGDGLTRQILLVTEWRHLMRSLPDVPVAGLEEESLTTQCFEAYLARYEEIAEDARAQFDSILDAIEVGDDQADSGANAS